VDGEEEHDREARGVNLSFFPTYEKHLDIQGHHILLAGGAFVLFSVLFTGMEGWTYTMLDMHMFFT
jgi:hypothetical protein